MKTSAFALISINHAPALLRNPPRPACRLDNLALAAGGRSESVVHSHAQKALSKGLTKEDIKHIALLAISTLGFPQDVAGLRWNNFMADAKPAA